MAISGQDSATPVDEIPLVSTVKSADIETVTPQDNNAIFDINSVAEDVTTTADNSVMSVTATVEIDTSTPVDEIPISSVGKIADADISLPVDETPILEINKVAAEDSSTITDGTATSAAAVYNAEGYFANDSGNYMATEYLVTIG